MKYIFDGISLQNKRASNMDRLLMDNTGTIRTLSIHNGPEVRFYHRYTDDCSFELVAEWHIDEHANPIAFDANNLYVFAVSNLGRNTNALVRMNPTTGEELEVVFVREDVDILGASVSAGRLTQVQYITDRVRWVFFCDM